MPKTARTAFYIESSPDPVLANLHEPAESGHGAAVLLLPAFGWQGVASAPIRREWADRLAAEGHVALRIDLPGTGDSGGGPSDPGRVAAWRNAVADAAATLRARHPERRVVAIGLGLGGVLAWTATAAGAVIDDLVLWGVPSRGRSVLRELQAFAALERDESSEFAPGGYTVSSETAADLASIDLTDLPLTGAAARRLLLISRDGLSTDDRTRQFARQIGLDVTEATGRGWGAMTSSPHDSVLPEAVVGLVSAWIDAGPVGSAIAAPANPSAAGVLSVAGARERPWRSQRDDGYRFGVLAEPRNPVSCRLGVLLLSGGVSYGPNRMWAESARRWAAQGVPVLRVEVEDHDPSDLDDCPYSREEKLYDHRYGVQASDAVADLVREGVADRWLVVGMCAGASWAFHAALRSPREISAAVLINPFVFDWEEDVAIAATVGGTKRLRKLDGWRRLVTGDVNPARVRAVAGHAVRTPVEWRQRRRRTRARIQREFKDLDRLRDADTRLTFLVGQDEPILDRFRGEGVLDGLHRWPNVTWRRLPTRDHSFRTLRHQIRVHQELDAALTAERHRLAGHQHASSPASQRRAEAVR